jgi:hypothetical protein
MVNGILIATLVGLLARIASAVWTGRWSRTWVGSGRTQSGRRYPGGPTQP